MGIDYNYIDETMDNQQETKMILCVIYQFTFVEVVISWVGSSETTRETFIILFYKRRYSPIIYENKCYLIMDSKFSRIYHKVGILLDF